MIFYENQTREFYIHSQNGFSFPPHLHRQIELFFCTRGQIDVTCNFQKKRLSKGMWMIVFPEQEHSYTVCGDCQGIMMIFKPSLLPSIAQYLNQTIVTPFVKCETQLLMQCVDWLISTSSTASPLTLKGALYAIMGTLFEQCQFTKLQSENELSPLSQLLKYLSQNYKTDLSLAKVAKAFGLNYSYLSRMFHKKTGCSFQKYIQELRIEEAKHLLSSSNAAIVDICFSCGFTTQRSFNRVFQEIVHCTPSEYRLHFTSTATNNTAP